MRIRVMVDVREPLKRSKRIKKQGGEAKTVTFKYERLETFCYLCGRMGHAENGCEMRFEMGEDDGVRGWGPELRVENRRGGGGGGRSKYLRDGKSEWVNPALNGGCTFGGNGNQESSMQKESQKKANGEGGSGNGGESNGGDKANDEGVNTIKKVAAIFQNPQLYFPIKTAEKLVTKPVVEGNTDEVMGEVMTVEEERKKRQRASEIEVQSEVIGSHAQGISVATMSPVNSNSTGGEQENVSGDAKKSQSKPFLSVGPVRQAYREP